MRDAGGYSKMNREIVRQLHKLGITIIPEILALRSNCYGLDISDIEQMGRGVAKTGDMPCIYGSLAPSLLTRAYKKNIVFTMMETENIVPTYINKCNYADEIWLPCDWNMNTFRQSGLTCSAYKIPLGVDTELYNPNVSPRVLGPGVDGKFVFLSVFGWSLRKGPDVLIRAFLRAFKSNPHVVLYVNSRMWGSESDNNNQKILDEIEMYKRMENAEGSNNIVHNGLGLEEEELPGLYKAAHCFVLPTRGEGFGLPLAEAGACEVPVITTRHGGQLEFLNDETAYFIDTEGFDTCKNLKLGMISSFYNDNSLVAKLGDKAIDDLAAQMLHVAKNYSEAKGKAKALREHLVNNFTWRHTAEKIADRLEQIL